MCRYACVSGTRFSSPANFWTAKLNPPPPRFCLLRLSVWFFSFLSFIFFGSTSQQFSRGPTFDIIKTSVTTWFLLIYTQTGFFLFSFKSLFFLSFSLSCSYLRCGFVVFLFLFHCCISWDQLDFVIFPLLLLIPFHARCRCLGDGRSFRPIRSLTLAVQMGWSADWIVS